MLKRGGLSFLSREEGKKKMKTKVVEQEEQGYPVVKPSRIANAGNGVFTTRSYKKSEFVCFFDGVQKEIDSLSDFQYSIVYEPDDSTLSHILVGYYPTPRSSLGVGQFINDACRPIVDGTDNKWETYLEDSRKNANVRFSTSNLQGTKLFATRDLEAGEELYVSYGQSFWVQIEIWEDKEKGDDRDHYLRVLLLRINCFEFHFIDEKKATVCFREQEMTATEFFAIWPKIGPEDPLFINLGTQELDDFHKLKDMLSLLQFPFTERKWRFLFEINRTGAWPYEKVESPWYASFEECNLAYIKRLRSELEKDANIKIPYGGTVEYKDWQDITHTNYYCKELVRGIVHHSARSLGITDAALCQFVGNLDFMIEYA